MVKPSTVAILLLAGWACSASAARRGPLAATADSVFAGMEFDCSKEIQLTEPEPVRWCRTSRGSAAHYLADRSGKVLWVIEIWPLDSVGRTARVAADLERGLGPPTQSGVNTDGEAFRSWTTDSVCISLVDRKVGHTEYNQSLREWAIKCH